VPYSVFISPKKLQCCVIQRKKVFITVSTVKLVNVETIDTYQSHLNEGASVLRTMITNISFVVTELCKVERTAHL
jgi:hypothetical protein